MSFTSPLVLLALVVPLLLVAWVFRRSTGRVVLPFDHASAGRGRWLFGMLAVAEAIPALLLAVVIVILAGPQRLGSPKTKRVLTNIEFCVDISGSMNAAFGEGTRYDGSMEAIDEFLDYREGDAFGLTFFGNAVLHWTPLTTDPSAIRCAPPFMRPGRVPRWFGGTEIGKALMSCRDLLVEREEGDRMIILVSDGYSADLSGGRDEEIARRLRDDGIIVYGVHIGSVDVPDPIVNITVLTGGEVFPAGDPDGLAAVFARIDEMQETRLEKVSADAMDHFEPYCVAGLVLLGAALVALWFLRYTPW